jgi:hypothetical protein
MKIGRACLMPVDYLMVVIGFFGLLAVSLKAIGGAAYAVWDQLRYSLGQRDERIVLIAFAVSFIWIAIRWKHINRRRGWSPKVSCAAMTCNSRLIILRNLIENLESTPVQNFPPHSCRF